MPSASNARKVNQYHTSAVHPQGFRASAVFSNGIIAEGLCMVVT